MAVSLITSSRVGETNCSYVVGISYPCFVVERELLLYTV